MPQLITQTKSFKKYEQHELTDEIVKSATNIVFDKWEVCPDELVYFQDGKIMLSSFAQGIVEWDKKEGQYYRQYHFSSNKIGQLKHILVEVSE